MSALTAGVAQQSLGLRADRQRRQPQRRQRVACAAGRQGDDAGARRSPLGTAGRATAAEEAAARVAAYTQLLDPLLSILALEPEALASTHLLRALVAAPNPAAVAKRHAGELDDQLFVTIRNCWQMGMRVFRATPRSQDAALYDGLILLDKAWSAAEEARSAAKEPELCLLKRLLNAYTEEERAALLSPPEAATALLSQNGLFFQLLEAEAMRCARNESWGDSFLEKEKTRRLAKLDSIRCEAQQRAAAAAAGDV